MRWYVALLLIAAGLLGMFGFRQDTAAQSMDALWNAEYFDNDIFQAPAVETGQIDSLSFYWADGSPSDKVPVDNFTARYGADVAFAAGTYRFYALADDYVAVTVDYQHKIIDTFNQNKVNEVVTGDITLPAGTFHIQVDYHELGGDAYIFVGFFNMADNPLIPTAAELLREPTLTNYDTVATVTAGVLNVRNIPTVQDSFVITKIRNGETYPVINRNDDGSWVQVNIAGTIGWVSARYVELRQIPPITDNTGVDNAFSVISLDNYVAVRATPSARSDTLTTLPLDDTAPIIGRTQNNRWFQIYYNNLYGWVAAPNVALTSDVILSAVPITG